MSQIITATEAQALPGRVSLGLDAGESVVVALTDEDPSLNDNLRQTLLRPEAALLPAGCSPLFAAELVESGRYPVLRVRRVGRHPVDLLRPEGRLRLTQNTELRSGARLEVMAPGRRPVSLGLLFAAQGSAGARSAAGGGGSRASAAMAAQTTLLWLVPNIAALIRDPLDDLFDGAMEWVAKSGISPRTFSFLIFGFFSLMATGAFGMLQYFEAEEAKAELAQSQDALAAAQASKSAALVAEAQCLVDRRALADQLGAQDAADRAAIELALASTAARALAVERGGAAYSDPAIGRPDAEATELDARAIQPRLAATRPGVAAAARCAEPQEALGQDLPPFVLHFHPDPTLWCPIGYRAVAGATELRGSWGLSDRVSAELGASSGLNADAALATVEGFDPRDVDRLSANLLAAGLRAVRATLLAPERGRRPVMAPAETNLWALALFGAANRLPKAAPGSEEAPLAACVAAVIDQLGASQTTAGPAEPILPPLARVASGAVVIPAAPPAACPWPDGSVAAGATAALTAATRAAAAAPAPAPLEE